MFGTRVSEREVGLIFLLQHSHKRSQLNWREDEGDGLPAAVTPVDGGQELVEVGTPHRHLQSGGGRHQYGPPVDVDILESGHYTSNLRQGRVFFWPPELNF